MTKAIHILSTAPARARMRQGDDFQYSPRPFEVICTALSALMWRNTNGPVGLFTDSYGYEYYRDIGILDVWDAGINTEVLENMPDIDQQEIIIGNYYAARLKAHTQAYCEWQRSACSYEENGQVLGIVSINQKLSRIERKALTPQADNASYDLPKFDGTTPTNIKLIGVEQTGTYTAYKDSKTSDEKTIISFLLIIPPYTVPDDVTPTLWLRQGKNRWSAPLPLPNDRTFESGKRYNIQMNKPTA